MAPINKQELTLKVKEMYKDVAEHPEKKYHFEMGRKLAEKLGYPIELLDKLPKESIDSFAGVGYYFDLINVEKGISILDLGSGSGMDSFFATLLTGNKGKVIGIDMTQEQLKKANELKEKDNFNNISFIESYIESLPFNNESFDLVISNGVINLSADKEKVFQEISRVLKKGGEMAIVCDVKIWASCIGGAMQQDNYKWDIQNSGMKIIKIKENPQYQFLSKSALGATKDFGVKSISLLAEKI